MSKEKRTIIEIIVFITMIAGAYLLGHQQGKNESVKIQITQPKDTVL